MNWAVIMAGGSGERFWPLSRRKTPKQLLAITAKRTMIQEAVDRLQIQPARVMVVTNAVQAPAVRRQLPAVKNIVAEPMGRNTAPCVALAAVMIARKDPDAVMVVVPADSWIGDVAKYRTVVRESLALAAKRDVLITIGISPTAPHTGYGYVQVGKKITGRFSEAVRFVEKPDLPTAKRYLASGQYRWNAGMFVWSARAILAAYRRHQPALLAEIEKIRDTRSLKRIYPTLEKISVDYAIMEKADNVVAANGDFPWDDVGDWAALARHFPSVDGNAVRGDFLGVNATDCVVYNSGGHLVGAVGVTGLVIVHTKDATLVSRKEDSQRVRDLVKLLPGAYL